MNTIISLLAFLFISVLGVKYVNSRNWSFVTSPYNPKQKLKVSARQRFVLFLLAMGVVQAGSFSATLLLVWIVLLLVLLSKYGTRFSDSPLFLIYSIYLIWLVFSLVRSPEQGFGFRMLAKYIFPFLVVLVTSSIPITDTFFVKALKVAFVSAVFINLYTVLPIGFITGPLLDPIIWWGPAIIDYNPFAIAVALVLYKLTKNKNYLYSIVLFSLPPVLEAVRTGLVGIGVLMLAISFFKYKLRALPAFIGILLVFIGSILFIPAIRDKMFRGAFKSADEVINSFGNASVLDNLETSGRSAMWEWSLNHFYKDNELIGSGIGQVQAMLYSGNSPFPELNALHSDYILILCDSGQIGLVLYLLILVVFVAHSFKIYNNKKNSESSRSSAFIAGTSLCGIMACAFTDNVINYSLITLTYPYAFFGFALALKKNK